MTGSEYDEQWAQLQDFIRYNPGARHRRRLIERLVRACDPPATVLDAGCGLGEMVELLHELFPGAAINGVDISELALASTAHRFPFATFEFLDVQNDVLNRTFDLVVSSEVIEHLDDQASAVANLSRMVAPGGSLIISVPSGKMFATERTFGHVRHPELAWLERTVEAHGLVVRQAFRWGFPTYLALKYVVNARPEVSMREFGSGTYSLLKKRLNDAIYLANFANLPNARRGCQAFLLATRPRVASR